MTRHHDMNWPLAPQTSLRDGPKADQYRGLKAPATFSHRSAMEAFTSPPNGRGFLVFIAMLCFMVLAGQVGAATLNGNDFALAFMDAKTPAAKKAVFDAAAGQPHFFRYLQIMEMEPGTEDGKAGVKIVAFEPGSYMDVKFVLAKPVSLSMLKANPETKIGDAVAVTGKVASIEPGKNVIVLEDTIMRNKDRLSPAMGKELLGEVKPDATFYSYTEGPRPIRLEYRDRDLLANRDRIMAEGGPKAWFEFLEKEIAKRKAERAAAAAAKEGAPR
jgi:hypothetical protein